MDKIIINVKEFSEQQSRGIIYRALCAYLLDELGNIKDEQNVEEINNLLTEYR
mgnify:CR=1 FL=1